MVGKAKKKPASGLDVEEAFPRGGGHGLAPIAQKQIEKEAYAEAEAELFGSKKGKKRKSSVDDQDADEDAFFSSLNSQGRVPKYAELLKFKSLSVGSKLWGAVVEVAPHSLVISLPHGLRGHVAFAQASDHFGEVARKQDTASRNGGQHAPEDAGIEGGRRQGPLLMELFSIGQLVRCCVTGLEGGQGEGKAGGKAKKRVHLSLHVSHINKELGAEGVKAGVALPGCVKSVEDHGYVITFGIKGTTGFLPKKDAPSPLLPGSLVEVVVAKTGAGGAAVVSCGREEVAGAVAREWEGLTIGSLVPGSLVSVRVRSVLSDGLLVSFLTFFTGTIDPFHLGIPPGENWRQKFSENQRLRARILYVDPSSKRVALTLAPHLLHFSLPHNFPVMGQVFEDAVVRRVDESLGLLCELPSSPGTAALTPGYAHISSVADDKVELLAKRFRLGQQVRCRVTGFRPMDGLAVLSLKPSVVDNNVVSYADVRPGQALSGTVLRVEDFGLVVSITPSIRATVPTLHMSDLGSKKAHKKYKEGQAVAGRVLAVDPATRRLTLTLKPALLGSKLPPITCLQDAFPGGRSHGMVTGVRDFGVFVSFYGGVSGLAHVSECGLPPDQKPTQAFQEGQVVKCRVLAQDPAHKGLKLSLVSKKRKAQGDAAAPATPSAAPAAAEGGAEGAAASEQQDALGALQAGDVVEGVVKSLETQERDGQAQPHHVEVEVVLEGGLVVRGRLDCAHLADHPQATAALWDVLKPGSPLGGLLVLQRLEGSKCLRLSRKASLVSAAASLPAALDDVKEGALLPGYVASVTGDAVFVRFLNGVTGRAGLAALSDTFVSDPHLQFREGQSVRAQVVSVDPKKQRFSLTLKQSLCGGQDAAFLASLFRDLDLAAELGAEDGEPADWAGDFAFGSIVSGVVDDIKEFGAVCDLEGHPDIVGLAAPHQAGGAAKGASVRGVVLDITRKEGVVDLSLLAPLLRLAEQAAAAGAQELEPAKKKRKKGGKNLAATAKWQLGQEVACTVQLSKAEEGYCVVIVQQEEGEGGAISQTFVAFLPTADYNLAGGAQLQHAPAPGDVVRARIAALPSPSTCGRLLLHAPLDPRSLRAATQRAQRDGKGAGSKAQQAHQQPKAGEVVTAVVQALHDVHAEVSLEGWPGCRGRLHICEAGATWGRLQQGGTVEVVVLGRIGSQEARRLGMTEVSAREEVLAGARASPPSPPPKPLLYTSVRRGQRLSGFVQEVAGDSVWCVFSPCVRGRAFLGYAGVTDVAGQGLEGKFSPGQAVQAHVLDVDSKRKQLEVSLVGPRSLPAAGDITLGRVLAVEGAGVRVQIGGRTVGKACLTDLHNSWVPNALEATPLAKGQLVRAAVVGNPTVAGGQVLLSLRPSHLQAAGADQGDAPPSSLPPSQLKPGQQVRGYVKAVGPAGAFVCLARDCEARVRLGQLADGFVEDPAAAFLPGALVSGRVLKAEGDRVELSLRTKGAPGAALEGLEEGNVVKGRVKRVEKFGVFVQLDSGATGLAHVSQLADDYVKDVAALFSTGQRVLARVLAVDPGASRLSLGLKPSYFEGCQLPELGEEEFQRQGSHDFEEEVQAAFMSEDDGSDHGRDGTTSDDDALGRRFGKACGSGHVSDSEAVEAEVELKEMQEGNFDLDEDIVLAEDEDANDSGL